MTSIAEDLAPAGVLRASINLGNPVLAQGTPAAPTCASWRSNPAREETVAFTEPYVLIEGVYVVPTDSALTRTAAVDTGGVRGGERRATRASKSAST